MRAALRSISPFSATPVSDIVAACPCLPLSSKQLAKAGMKVREANCIPTHEPRQGMRPK